MPQYPFQCPKCETMQDLVLMIADRDDPQKCPKCKTIMERQMCAPRVNVASGYQSYSLENNGKGRYFSQLARKMPYGRNDPNAYFKDVEKAKDVAKRKADTDPQFQYENAS